MISVIIPAYNVEEYIEQCIDSFLEQSVEDIEIIVVDDGSTDGTLDLCRAYEARDPRMRVLRQEHRTAGAARNLGMGSASGDYLLFFDADDYALPGMLEKMLARAEETGTEIVHCKALHFRETDGVEEVIKYLQPLDVDMSSICTYAEYAPRLYQMFAGWSWDKLFRADFVRERGLQFQDITSTNDAFFVYSALSEASAVSFVDEVLMAHRKRSGSIETARSPHNAKLAFDAILARLDERECDDSLLRRSLFNWGFAHLRWNLQSFEGEQRRECMDDYYEVLELCRDFGEDDFFYPDDLHMYKLSYKGLGPRYEVIDMTNLIQRLDCEVERLNAEVARRDGQIAQRDEWLAEKDERIKELASALVELDAKLEEVLGSTTWKVGKMATALPRKIKDATP